MVKISLDKVLKEKDLTRYKLAQKTGNSSLTKGYEDGLNEVLKLKLN